MPEGLLPAIDPFDFDPILEFFMNKSFSAMLIALVSVAAAQNCLAQSETASSASSVRVIQVATTHQVTPVMTHDVATMIKLSHQAQAQYRRTGSSQDLARVNAMRHELASLGFGRATQPAPAMAADAQLASTGQ
jgi:hypothetical protein